MAAGSMAHSAPTNCYRFANCYRFECQTAEFSLAYTFALAGCDRAPRVDAVARFPRENEGAGKAGCPLIVTFSAVFSQGPGSVPNIVPNTCEVLLSSPLNISRELNLNWLVTLASRVLG